MPRKRKTESEVKPTPKTIVYTTTTNLNLRNKPGDMSNDAIVTIIPKDTKIVGLAEETTIDDVRWVNVRYGKNIGWVMSKYIN